MPNTSTILPEFRQSVHSQGMALVLCLLLITTLCLVGGAALSVSGLNRKIVHNSAKQAQSFYLAEAGRELALAYLKEDPLRRGFGGELPAGGHTGNFSVTVWDCTADGNGIYDALIPAGHVRVESAGTWTDATQSVSCLARIRPAEGSAATFPGGVVVTSGAITGSLTALDEMGGEDGLLLTTGAALPAANENALKAMADMAFDVLDDGTFDAALGGIGDFWRDAPADTRPYIFYVQGDLELGGNRQLHGIVFVAGTTVSLEDTSGIQGVLYAPVATNVAIENSGVSGRIVVTGQVVTGSGGIWVAGNPVAVQHGPEYAAAFNDAAGDDWEVAMVSGSWTSY